MTTYYLEWRGYDTCTREPMDATTLDEAKLEGEKKVEEWLHSFGEYPATFEWGVADDARIVLHEAEAFVCQPEPDCDHPDGHEWDDGDAWGHGGGIQRTDTCARCGLLKHIDTWGQIGANQGYHITEYEQPAD
jgi:hypothetical protein